MKKNKHPTEIPGYEGRMNELVDFIVGKLRFDKGQEFHELLSKRYFLESEKEKEIGHPKAQKELLEISKSEKLTTEGLKKLWAICERYTE